VAAVRRSTTEHSQHLGESEVGLVLPASAHNASGKTVHNHMVWDVGEEERASNDHAVRADGLRVDDVRCQAFGAVVADAEVAAGRRFRPEVHKVTQRIVVVDRGIRPEERALANRATVADHRARHHDWAATDRRCARGRGVRMHGTDRFELATHGPCAIETTATGEVVPDGHEERGGRCGGNGHG
jgi:hypothetical protein